MGCTAGIIKYLVFLFNLVFAIAGLILLVVGILYQFNINEMRSGLEGSAIGSAPTVLIILGAIIFIIAFFGCCGAIRESTCMLTSYGVILLVILILQIAIGVFAFMQVKEGGSLRTEIRNGLQKTFQRRQNGDEAARESFALLEHSFKCCGVDSYEDYSGSDLPPSCCSSNRAPCLRGSQDVFHEGCSRKVYGTLKNNMQTIGYIALGLCITEIVAAVFALCLTSSIKNERRRGYA